MTQRRQNQQMSITDNVWTSFSKVRIGRC